MRQKSRLTWALFPKVDKKANPAAWVDPLLSPARVRAGPRRLWQQGYAWVAAAVGRRRPDGQASNSDRSRP